MGYQLMRQVTTLTLAGRLPGLSPNARLVLMGMAGHAHDEGTKRIPRGHYFGGWEHLAMGCLGYPKYTPTAERAVARAITELVEAGLVETVGWRGSSRGPRVYLLNVHMW